jgi:hypothetical protein
VPEDLRAFLREAFDDPVVGILPAVVDLLHFASHRQAVLGQRDLVAPAHEQEAGSGSGDRVARIDAPDLEIDRFAPGAANALGPDHVV